ncbi:hypothetical protein KQ302_01555 [Synechococcus sp. CS-602]|nr:MULTISPECIES: hypothetical protein [Synechococcaceae]APD49145.1 hypothetical protein BM449_00560 [Synechococcus sp. SynAce01]MCT4365676.1 hypothetical protein [Candidatus Regnicoccus frigidus MAG-AL1]MCT0203806.1 hypothetical protein [Synechococcus sp. CS-602]MCT0246334.1 hypothetical protein [Synechococcus sp. CS-601]MCT4368357.1 hypothetical protein [Candidatus Regnicoccus frigidus MAG-AL2]
MAYALDSLSRQDPLAVVQSCHSTLLGLLRRQQGRPIKRLWIDHPYGEEELALLEEELLPAMEQFLVRVGEIDAAIEAAADRASEISSAA